MHLVDHARARIEETYRRPLIDRGLRALLARLLPYPRRFRFALRLAPLGRPFAPLFELIGAKRIAAMLRLAPPRLRGSEVRPGIHPAEGKRRARVALLSGCVDPVVMPSIREAAIRVLTRRSVEVVLAEGEACCGSLVHHMGRAEDARRQVKNNIDVWTRELEGEGLDAILITASGCGTTIKDYGFMLRQDPAYAAKAARISALAKDVSEFLLQLDPPQESSLDTRVAYHSACSMQHGQKITREPKELLGRAGFEVVEVPEGHLCCGSAGTYNMLQPELSAGLRARKVANIERTAPDVVATGNIGCIVQIAQGTKIPVVHMVELLDWAGGGPLPEALGDKDFRSGYEDGGG
jgi:glycolate oxidase iron-sulfur subunit